MKKLTIEEVRNKIANNDKDFSNCDLSQLHLSGTNLRDANLSSANLSNVDLCYADLHHANLRGANLSSADLRGTNLRNADLRGAITDKRYIQISCIGSSKRMTTYCFEDDIIWCGCFKGTLTEFEKQVKENHKDNDQYLNEYLGFIEYIKFLIEAQ